MSHVRILLTVALFVAIVGMLAGYALTREASAAHAPPGSEIEAVGVAASQGYDPLPVTLWGHSWRKRVSAANR